MRLERIVIRNFRLLRRFSINLAADKPATILVGANNSGKTSVMEALQLCLGEGGESRKRICLHDFSAARRKDFGHIQVAIETAADDEARVRIVRRFAPRIRMDLHFRYTEEPADLVVAADLLMSLEPTDDHVAIRIEYGIEDSKQLVSDYRGRRRVSETMLEFLSDKVHRYYGMSYAKISENGMDSEPLVRGDVLRQLIKVDSISAQRHISDEESAHARKLSKLLHEHYSTFYKVDDVDGFNAIEDNISGMSIALTGQYEKAFKRLAARLKSFGYPQGHSSPDMKVKAELSAAAIYKDNTQIYYSVESPSAKSADDRFELPEKYNGLGYKNLIFIVLELESFRAALEAIEVDRPRVHVIAIEEPEVHLHPHMQCVFIKEITRSIQGDGKSTAQVVLSTHSSHVVADSGFEPIRYFKRVGQEVIVKDLSQMVVSEDAEATLQFLRRYMKLTHCDLFFADKAILVEGQVERLLIPLMIDKATEADGFAGLKNQYLTLLEVGGAYAHVFEPLIEFIQIPTLVITDIDAVDANGEKCPTISGVGSSNAALTKWIPKKMTLAELNSADHTAKTRNHIRVAYQIVESGNCGRSFEEAFIYANVEWLTSNHAKLPATGAKFEKAIAKGLVTEAYGLGGRIGKVDFALDLVRLNDWNTPAYILEGLKWLASQEPSK